MAEDNKDMDEISLLLQDLEEKEPTSSSAEKKKEEVVDLEEDELLPLEEELEEGIELKDEKKKGFLENLRSRIKWIPIKVGIFFLIAFLGIGVSSYFLTKGLKTKRHVRKGTEFINRGEFELAEQELDKALSSCFSEDKVLNQFGETYLKNRELVRAYNKLKKALGVNPKNIPAQYNLSHLYILRGELSKVEEICENILINKPKDKFALVTLADVCLKLGNFKKASFFAHKAIEVSPKNKKALLVLLKTYIEEGKYEDALKIHRYLYNLSEGKIFDPHSLTRLGAFYLQKDPETSEKLLKLATKRNIPKAYYYLGRIYLKKGELNQALSSLKKAVSQLTFEDPLYSETYSLLGKIHLKCGMLRKAEEELQEAINSNSKNGEANFDLGNVYYNLGEIERAIPFYEKAEHLGVTEELLYYNLGVGYYQAKRYDDALRRFSMLRSSPNVCYNLGNTCLHLDMLEQAKVKYQEVIMKDKHALHDQVHFISAAEEKDIYRRLRKAYNNIGVVYEKLKDEKQAMLSYSQSAECASFFGKGRNLARENLNRVFLGRPILSIESAIYDEVEKRYR
ncbi:MAG: tetratricopeptide repeat protein [bacterium]|nr:tetratricopeptide repeat protein [bacterium]